MSNYLQKLQELLRELFQFDSADLDFGFYAVMNQKREQVAAFVEEQLPVAVQTGLGAVAEQSRQEAQVAFERARQNVLNTLGSGVLKRDVLDLQYERTPIGEAYQQAKDTRDNAAVAEDLEAQLYNDLYTFFARYYQDGDFISQRRYGATDKYAIPYNGQEVHLHWANFDQYYVKTGVHFHNYSFTLPRGVVFDHDPRVHFRLTKADTPRDNNKGEKRFFIYHEEQGVSWDEANDTLTIPMEYRPLTKEESERLGTRDQQQKLVEEAHTAVLATVPSTTLRARLLEPDPNRRSEKGRLAYHLHRYAAENQRDFFVHKDLGGFLRRELDYYLKAEVLRLEDVNFDDPLHVRRAAARLKTTRAIAGTIITFLDQLERFQRRLFLKRKFVLQSDYCLTLDKIPTDRRADFYPAILANQRQLAEWKTLYEATITPETDLVLYLHLMLDTAFFDIPFKARLLACFDDLNAITDGFLIHSENFQALNLLQTRYSGRVDHIFIDPPYNTGNDGFIYKDNYQHSSWLTMMADRLEAVHPLFTSTGIISSTIDYVEVSRLRLLFDLVFGQHNFLADIAWEKRYTRSNNARLFYSLKDTVLVYRSSDRLTLVREPRSEKSRESYSNPDSDSRGDWISSSYVNPALKQERPNLVYEIENPHTYRKIVHPTHAWKYDYQTHLQHWADNRLYWGVNNDYEYPRLKSFLIEASEGMVPVDVWRYEDAGTTDEGGNVIKRLFGKAVFDNPKPPTLIGRILNLESDQLRTSLVLDFFAGSGTTAHAVMQLNQEDDGNRKYILVEMGDYFDTVLKPRIQKVAYADEWRDGRPVLPPNGQTQLLSTTGQSHMFHYIRLESYDDTFHNIHFRDVDGPQLRLLDTMPDFFLGYLLDHETAGSPTLLDVEQFRRPFDYTLLVTSEDGVLRPQPVDLLTTFNFLLGLAVQTIRHYEYEGNPIVRVSGLSPDGKQVCVLWRNVLPLEQLDAERDWVLAHILHDVAYDKLYVNGENTIPRALLTEEEFKRRMFEEIGD